ncbi:hypothetical protein M9H77_12616 [Catharanthus roseus]|uniref:Uncharacterized protein n=1 Tax=Catharanthus roseus TaxID=4058 RepID=A0ACC0BI31_CATRO|nr:hypothetical protein M9H77_12616 [Catharanthus roseus]
MKLTMFLALERGFRVLTLVALRNPCFQLMVKGKEETQLLEKITALSSIRIVAASKAASTTASSNGGCSFFFNLFCSYFGVLLQLLFLLQFLRQLPASTASDSAIIFDYCGFNFCYCG